MKYHIVTFFVFLCFSASAQTINVDSLRSSFESMPPGKPKRDVAISLTNIYLDKINQQEAMKYAKESIQAAESLPPASKVKPYCILCSVYWAMNDYTSALQAAEKALEYANQDSNSDAIEMANNSIGNTYYRMGNYYDAERYFLVSLENAQKTNNKSSIGSLYNNLANVNLAKGNLDKSVSYSIEALKLKEALNDEKGIAMVCNNIANAYRKLQQPEKALQYQLKSLAIKEKLNDTKGIAFSLGNIGNVYHDLGDTQKAISCYLKALKYQAQLKDDLLIGNTYNSLGYVSYERGDYKKAMEYYQLSLHHRSKTGNKSALSGLYNNMAKVYVATDELDKAEGLFNKALMIAKANGEKEDIADANIGLADVSRQRKDFEKSLNYMMDAEKAKDSIYNVTSSKAIAEMQTKYETEKKEASIRLLQKENELKDIRYKKTVFMFVALFVAIAAVSIIIYTYSYFKRHKKVEQLRAEAEYKRINAIVNAQEEERKRISAELHDGLGQVLSAVKLNVSMLKDDLGQNASTLSQYNTAMLLLDQSCNEVRNMSHSMMPAILVKMGLREALRELASAINNTGVLKVMVDDNELDDEPAEFIKIHLYRIVQELLNNIIKYACATEVQIQFSKDSHGLGLMIEDNGKGFDTTVLNNSNGLGWHSIQSRIALLKGQIEVDSKPSTAGTVVFVTVPAVDVL